MATYKTEPLAGCFITTDNLRRVRVAIHITYNQDGFPHRWFYTEADVASWGAPIDPAVYLGGGRVVVGPCGDDQFDYECGCDDIAGDGSNIQQYIEVYARAVGDSGIAAQLLGTFTDKTMTTPYVPINGVDCKTLGEPAVTKQGRMELLGGSWSPRPLMTSYTLRVASIANPMLPPTFQDSTGNVTALELGEVVSFTNDAEFIDLLPIVTTSAGDRVVVTYLELGVA